jgi:hypothetical protein
MRHCSKGPILAALCQQRKVRVTVLRSSAQPASQEVDAAGINALLLAGLHYLALREQSVGTFAVMDIRRGEGHARIAKAFALITGAVYRTSPSPKRSDRMNTHKNPPQELASLKAWLALFIVIFLIAASLPYSWLIAHFCYDDILREPTGKILTEFHSGGAALVLAWFAFAMSALMFIPVAMGFEKLLDAHWASVHGATMLGVASAIAQTIGLLRWVLVVPTRLSIDQALSPIARD